MKTREEISAENKNAYLEQENKKRVSVRVNARERSVIEDMMRSEGWINMSAFIKHKIFGYDSEKKIDEIIDSGEPDRIGRLLRNEMMDLANSYIYFRYRYEKDMNQLYTEPGVNLKDWINATNQWHTAFIEKTNDSFILMRKIAFKLGLDDFFINDSDSMRLDLEHATKKELDKLAEQMRLEKISLGLPNTFE